MPTTFEDKIRGMLLLGAYADTLGAAQEGQEMPTPDPVPKTLAPRDMPEWGEAWGTWLPAIVHAKRIGMPTDSTCYRLCTLHPWLEAIADGKSTFDETSLHAFMTELQHEPLYPEWYSFACRDQLKDWSAMFQAQQEERSEVFFNPGVPVIFGLYLYLEVATVHYGATPAETFALYERQAGLDQGYAKIVTAFLATLVSLAVQEILTEATFSDWFFRSSQAVLDAGVASGADSQELSILRGMLDSMQTLGKNLQGETEATFNTAFKEQVIDPAHPPFMNQSFLGGVADPYRTVAQIAATIAYANDDPAAVLRTFAYSYGDTDAIASLLGTLMGAWYGERGLYAAQSKGVDLRAEIAVVESNLTELFHLDLEQRVQVFVRLSEKS
jgi:hypothetical protein